MSKMRPSRRVVRERWDGAAFNVTVEHTERHGDVTVLALMHIGLDGNPEHIVEVPLDDGSRRTLAQALTGGIVIAHPSAPNGGG